MRVVARAGNPDLATVYLADMGEERLVEFVESVQPPWTRAQKWVIIISTLVGCPVGCAICDAGGRYRGPLSCEEMLAQIAFLVDRDYPDGRVPVEKFKVQFARMGEPAFNPAVLDALEALPGRWRAPGLLPSLSTIAPRGCDRFFVRLRELKTALYGGGRFQLQFSLHSSDPDQRDRLMPAPKWDFAQIAAYGERFVSPGDRRITLNIALAEDTVVEAPVLRRFFHPDLFLIKATPVNPTLGARRHGLRNGLPDTGTAPACVDALRSAGYEVIVSIGELEENRIGSNCGQFVRRFLEKGRAGETAAYTYGVEYL